MSQAGEFYIFKIPWPDVLSPDRSVSYEKRQFPIIRYNSADMIFTKMEIILPDNLEPSSMPPNKTFSNPAGEYTVEYKIADKGLECTREYIYKNRTISVADYAEYKKFYDQVQKADQVQILLKEKEM